MDCPSKKILTAMLDKLEDLKVVDDASRNKMNIISILGKETDELIMCKILWGILNYKIGSKCVYVESFAKQVLGIDISDGSFRSAKVYREYCIPNSNRRIDIVIKTPKVFVPIEAKIYADDQENQCADYLDYTKNYYDDGKQATLFYLTINGNKPSYRSLSWNKSLLKDIRLISWFDILSWLEGVNCPDSESEDIIRQYCKALEALLNRKRGEIEMKIDEMIDSPDCMRAAIEIEKSLNRKKTALLHSLFEDIIDKVDNETNLDYDPLLNEPWDYRKSVDDYYSRRLSSSTYPALTYNMGLLDKLEDGTEYYFILRFEIEWRAYVGFAIMRRSEDGELFTEDNPSELLISKAKALVFEPDKLEHEKGWWLYWEYVTSNNQEIIDNEPDFRTMNEAYLSLYDTNGKEAFVEQVIQTLKKFKSSVKS
ncbi:PDDEXK-like family protein [Butyrivibrio sp. AE3004]|uniref:PDDEXK-like family protein n=1 Tax=Butyrivibrio sp. AE3004 TaxID=1506994 RepID=UPI000494BF46|nr:PD-(D/E)XK nuclease family protein [Butyrivibrio sp. AE3004]